MTERSTASLPATLGFVDGRSATGSLVDFSPELAFVAFEADGPLGRVRERLAAERIAYVAYHRRPTDAPPQQDAEAARFKIHLNGSVLVVDAATTPDVGAVGFTAFPCDARGPYREFFFYNHGVILRERDERIGTMLVTEGVLRQEALDDALEVQKTPRLSEDGTTVGRKLLGEVLTDLRLVTELDIARALAKKFDLPVHDLDRDPPDPQALIDVPRELVLRYGLVPIAIDSKRLTVGTSDPLVREGIDVLRFHLKRRIDEVLVTPSQIKKHLADRATVDAAAPAVAKEAAPVPDGVKHVLEKLTARDAAPEAEDQDEEVTTDEAFDGTIVNLVNQIIVDAHRRGASDIHIEPNGRERPTVVRLRIDGDCVAYMDIPGAHGTSVVARVKILAKLDIAERRKPQDGKARLRLPGGRLELRVATMPTVNGNEDVVLRILASSKPVELEALKMSARNLAELQRLIAQPYGLLLCVGPTGSGKTTTLHSALGKINTVDTKIWTAEDPVEITQVGLRQVQVNPRIGFTFAQAMRGFLRADPDVIMVGEMRDQETANTAVEASLTGHLVLSTLHTNSAAETVTRLLDMGLDPFSFGDALLGVLAQRLARTLCSKCRVRAPGATADYEELARAYGGDFEADLGSHIGNSFMVWRADGCDACGNTGYRGRVGIHELLVADAAVKQAILRKASVDEIRALAAAQGMRTLLQDGIAKVLVGDTDLKQVLAVCSK